MKKISGEVRERERNDRTRETVFVCMREEEREIRERERKNREREIYTVFFVE